MVTQRVVNSILGKIRERCITGKGEDMKLWAEKKSVSQQRFEYLQLGREITKSTIAVAFSFDGQLMGSTHGDHTVKITVFATSKVVQSLRGHPRTPWTVKFHPKNPFIVASGCLGFEVRIWNAKTGQCLHSATLQAPIISISFHPSGSILAIASGEMVYLWDYNNKSKPFPEWSHTHHLRCVHFTPDGHRIIVGAANRSSAASQNRAASGRTTTDVTFSLMMWDVSLKAAALENCTAFSFVRVQHKDKRNFPFAMDNLLKDRGARRCVPVAVPRIKCRTVLHDALLYNDGGFDVSQDGLWLVAIAELKEAQRNPTQAAMTSSDASTANLKANLNRRALTRGDILKRYRDAAVGRNTVPVRAVSKSLRPRGELDVTSSACGNGGGQRERERAKLENPSRAAHSEGGDKRGACSGAHPKACEHVAAPATTKAAAAAVPVSEDQASRPGEQVQSLSGKAPGGLAALHSLRKRSRLPESVRLRQRCLEGACDKVTAAVDARNSVVPAEAVRSVRARDLARKPSCRVSLKRRLGSSLNGTGGCRSGDNIRRSFPRTSYAAGPALARGSARWEKNGVQRTNHCGGKPSEAPSSPMLHPTGKGREELRTSRDGENAKDTRTPAPGGGYLRTPPPHLSSSAPRSSMRRSAESRSPPPSLRTELGASGDGGNAKHTRAPGPGGVCLRIPPPHSIPSALHSPARRVMLPQQVPTLVSPATQPFEQHAEQEISGLEQAELPSLFFLQAPGSSAQWEGVSTTGDERVGRFASVGERFGRFASVGERVGGSATVGETVEKGRRAHKPSFALFDEDARSEESSARLQGQGAHESSSTISDAAVRYLLDGRGWDSESSTRLEGNVVNGIRREMSEDAVRHLLSGSGWSRESSSRARSNGTDGTRREIAGGAGGTDDYGVMHDISGGGYGGVQTDAPRHNTDILVDDNGSNVIPHLVRVWLHADELQGRRAHVVRSMPMDRAKAKQVTSVKLSPSGSYVLLGAGVRGAQNSRQAGTYGQLGARTQNPSNGHSNGAAAEPTTDMITSIYRTQDLQSVNMMSEVEDDVNIACFHPEPGMGCVYGTKQGQLCVVRPGD